VSGLWGEVLGVPCPGMLGDAGGKSGGGEEVKENVESDEELRGRIAEKYGRWGAFLTVVIESRGAALDECAKHVGLVRGKL